MNVNIVCPHCQHFVEVNADEMEHGVFYNCPKCSTSFVLMCISGVWVTSSTPDEYQPMLDSMSKELVSLFDLLAGSFDRSKVPIANLLACGCGGCKEELEKRHAGQSEKSAEQVAAMTVPQILKHGAEIYEDRQKQYGDNYKHFGTVMSGLFPNGIHIDADDNAALIRLGLVLNCVTKLARYTNDIHKGHADSAQDLSVFAAILKEMTQ